MVLEFARMEIFGRKLSGRVCGLRKHRDFVIGLTGYTGNLRVVPAGSIKNNFLEVKENPTDLLRLAYVGQLDGRRGVEDIFDLSDSLTTEGISHKIHVCGSGDRGKFSWRGASPRSLWFSRVNSPM